MLSSAKYRLSIIVLVLLILGAGTWMWHLYSTLNGDSNSDRMAYAGPRLRLPAQRFASRLKPASPQQRQAAAHSITAQLEAFKKDDWVAASKYQSAALKRNFGSVDQFQKAIEGSYPEFADYKKVVFKSARATGNFLVMEVDLTGQDGKLVHALYSLIKEDGTYKIQGVNGGVTRQPNAGNPADMV